MLGLNPSRALESTPSNPYPRPLLYSPPLTSIPHLESVTKAPCSFSAVLISSISPKIGSSPTVSMGTRQTAPPNVIVSMFGFPSSPFAYTILPSHGSLLVPNSTNSTDALPHLSGCNNLDKGNAVINTIELMCCFMCHENHFDVHPQFFVLQLDLINPSMHSTCLLLATGIGIIQHKSRLLHLMVQSQYMRSCSCSNLSTDYVVSMTEMHGFFHDWELCIYEHEPYHISIVGVCPFATTHVIPPLQRLVGLVLITDPMVILNAFGKHFNGPKSVVECTATYLVDVIASLFVSNNTLSQLVERHYKTLDRLNVNGLLPLHDLIELASTDFGLNASEMIFFVYLEGLLGHAQESIGLPVWSNDGPHGLAGNIQILGIASMIEEPEMIFMEPITQGQTSKNFSDP
ncbi:hypothetical protein ACFX2I_013479 [Malus domestica]